MTGQKLLESNLVQSVLRIFFVQTVKKIRVHATVGLGQSPGRAWGKNLISMFLISRKLLYSVTTSSSQTTV